MKSNYCTYCPTQTQCEYKKIDSICEKAAAFEAGRRDKESVLNLKTKMVYSEKYLERKLGETMKREGGLSIKLLSQFVTGLPDRMCLLKGRMCFVEVKTTGKKPRPPQIAAHRMLEGHGFRVFVLDRPDGLPEIIDYMKNGN